MFKQTWHLLAVITKQGSIESQKVMYHVQTDMALTRCDYKAREHGKSESDLPCSKFKQTWHLLAVMTKQESMESQKVMFHVQTLTSCDYKAREHRKSESDVPCSCRLSTYILNPSVWQVRR